AAQASKTTVAPAQEGMQDHLSVAAGLKTRSLLLELLPHLPVIENLAVEDDHDIAIGADQGLVATLEVQNAETGRAERDQVGFKAPVMVRTAMIERFQGRIQDAAKQTFIYVRVPEDATHPVSAFFGQKIVRVFPLRRTHFCDRMDRPQKKSFLVRPSHHTHAVFSPHGLFWQRCRDYTRQSTIAKQKIKNCKAHRRGWAPLPGMFFRSRRLRFTGPGRTKVRRPSIYHAGLSSGASVPA